MGKEKNIPISKLIVKVIHRIFNHCPILTILSLLSGIIFGLSCAINTYITQKFFDEVNRVVNASGKISTLIMMAFILCSVIVISQIAKGAYNFVYDVLFNKVLGFLHESINNKISKLDPIIFEDTALLDTINKAKNGAKGCIGLFSVFSTLVTFYLPYYIFMGWYLFKLDKILTLSLVFIFIPVALAQFIRVKVFNKLEDDIAPIRREYNYYESCICEKEYFKETRILGAFNYFKGLYESSLDILGHKIWKAEKKMGLLELFMKLITLVGYLGVLYLLCRSLFNGRISIGAFAAVFSSIEFMIILMEEILSFHIGRLTKELGATRNFIYFFDLPERIGEDLEINLDNGIALKNVSFIYPCAKYFSLNDISLTIHPKETIAIVGENGSGKSTLVKLLMGLYLPTEGIVEFGGIDTKKISSYSLYKHTSGVFQNYQRYKMTLAENIYISDTENSSEQLINLSIKKAELNIDIDNFSQGIHTMLSREFNGIDLSGGQWQKVAIARGFFKNHSLIVLDEPTSSIDPIEETKLYNNFKNISKNKTSIIVTHRIGSAKIADRIIVMCDGKIAEIGAHKELLNNNGKYSEMYKSQSNWYSV